MSANSAQSNGGITRSHASSNTARPPSGSGDVLTWEAVGKNVNRFHRGPVDLAHVSEVGHLSHAVSEDRADVWVAVGNPHDSSAAESREQAEIKTAVARAQRADSHVGAAKDDLTQRGHNDVPPSRPTD